MASPASSEAEPRRPWPGLGCWPQPPTQSSSPALSSARTSGNTGLGGSYFQVRGMPSPSGGKGARPTRLPCPGPTRGSGTFLLCAARVQARLGAAQMQHFLPASLVGQDWEGLPLGSWAQDIYTPPQTKSLAQPRRERPPWVTMFSSASRKLEGCQWGGQGWGAHRGGGAYPRAWGARQSSSPLQASHSLRAKEGWVGAEQGLLPAPPMMTPKTHSCGGYMPVPG